MRDYSGMIKDDIVCRRLSDVWAGFYNCIERRQAGRASCRIRDEYSLVGIPSLHMSWPMQSNMAKRFRYVRSIIAILLMWPVAEKHRTQDCSLSSPSCVSRNPGRSWATTELSPRTRHVSGEHRRGFFALFNNEEEEKREERSVKFFWPLIAGGFQCGAQPEPTIGQSFTTAGHEQIAPCRGWT